MTAASWTALGVVVFGALCYAAASIFQAVAVRRSPTTVRAMRHPLYLAGIGCDILAWIGAMVALRELAVYVVESVLAGSLAITVIAARIFLKARLRRRDVFAVVVSVTALGVLALSAGPQHDVTPTAALKLGFCAAAAIIVLLGWGATKLGKPGPVAVLAGLSIGSGSLAGRALAMPDADGVLPIALGLVTDPQVWALLTFAATGMVLYANALRLGQVGPVTAVLWISEVIAPSMVAVLLLGDTVRAGWALPAAIAALVTVAGAAVLATAPANEATAETAQPALPAEPARPALAAAPTAPQPSAAAAAATHAERVIWWGPSPIWIPPSRAMPAALTAQSSMPELTWTPLRVQATWPEPQRPGADTVEPEPVVRRPARRPWPEYYPPEAVPAPIPAPAAEKPWPWGAL
jgi:hypothetical protein